MPCAGTLAYWRVDGQAVERLLRQRPDGNILALEPLGSDDHHHARQAPAGCASSTSRRAPRRRRPDPRRPSSTPDRASVHVRHRRGRRRSRPVDGSSTQAPSGSTADQQSRRADPGRCSTVEHGRAGLATFSDLVIRHSRQLHARADDRRRRIRRATVESTVPGRSACVDGLRRRRSAHARSSTATKGTSSVTLTGHRRDRQRLRAALAQAGRRPARPRPAAAGYTPRPVGSDYYEFQLIGVAGRQDDRRCEYTQGGDEERSAGVARGLLRGARAARLRREERQPPPSRSTTTVDGPAPATGFAGLLPNCPSDARRSRACRAAAAPPGGGAIITVFVPARLEGDPRMH